MNKALLGASIAALLSMSVGSAGAAGGAADAHSGATRMPPATDVPAAGVSRPGSEHSTATAGAPRYESSVRQDYRENLQVCGDLAGDARDACIARARATAEAPQGRPKDPARR